MSERTVTITCPNCGGEIPVTLVYEPPERGYGADADGRRGIDLPGYWEVIELDCSCDLTSVERAMIEKDAEEAAAALDEDDYHGPDGPEDRDE